MNGMPPWALKMTRRMLGLEPGRFLIILTKEGDGAVDWSVQRVGNVERPGKAGRADSYRPTRATRRGRDST